MAHLLKKNSSTWRLGKANRNCFQGLSGKWSGLRIELAREVDSGASAMKGVEGMPLTELQLAGCCSKTSYVIGSRIVRHKSS